MFSSHSAARYDSAVTQDQTDSSARAFLAKEQRYAGWRFWVLWVLATNAGFWLGVAVEVSLVGRITNLAAVPLGGLAQAFVLNRHLPAPWAWALASAAGWWVGMLIAGPLLERWASQLSFWPYAMLFALIAGAIVGVSTLWALRRGGLPVGWWWVPISALAWGVQAPPAWCDRSCA